MEELIMNCSNCGKSISSADQEFCDGCGTRLSQQSQAPTQQVNYQPTQPAQQSFQQKPPELNNTKQLVFAIINLLCCCFPLGIVSLIFAITAKSEPTAEAQQKKLKTSMTCSIIGIIVGALAIVIYLIIMILIPFLTSL